MHSCSTHADAFADHGIEDGANLISKAYYILARQNIRTPDASSAFVTQVARAFRQAYIQHAAIPLVPEPIDAAIDDAADMLVHAVLDEPAADLRTELLPVFYHQVATLYCSHLEAGGDPGTVEIWYER